MIVSFTLKVKIKISEVLKINVHLRFIFLSRVTGNGLRGLATAAAAVLYTAAAISIWQSSSACGNPPEPPHFAMRALAARRAGPSISS